MSVRLVMNPPTVRFRRRWWLGRRVLAEREFSDIHPSFSPPEVEVSRDIKPDTILRSCRRAREGRDKVNKRINAGRVNAHRGILHLKTFTSPVSPRFFARLGGKLTTIQRLCPLPVGIARFEGVQSL